jgi:hypothetical protein
MPFRLKVIENESDVVSLEKRREETEVLDTGICSFI